MRSVLLAARPGYGQTRDMTLFHGFCVLKIWENEPGKGKDLVDALFNQFKTNAKYRVSRTQTAMLACTSVHLCRLEPAAGHDHRCVQDAP